MFFKRRKKCACCRKYRFEPDARHEICPVCGWEQDRVQEEDPDFAGGANHLSLREARAEYKARRKAGEVPVTEKPEVEEDSAPLAPEDCSEDSAPLAPEEKEEGKISE